MCEFAICRKSWHFTRWLRPYALRGPLVRGEGVPPGPSGQVRGRSVDRDAGVALSRPLTLSTAPFGSFSARLLLVAGHASRGAVVECCCAAECDGDLVVGVDVALAGSALIATVDASIPVSAQYGLGPASVLLGGGAGCASIGPCHDGYGSDLGSPQSLCLSPGQGPRFIGGSHIRSSWTTTQKNPLLSRIAVLLLSCALLRSDDCIGGPLGREPLGLDAFPPVDPCHGPPPRRGRSDVDVDLCATVFGTRQCTSCIRATPFHAASESGCFPA